MFMAVSRPYLDRWMYSINNLKHRNSIAAYDNAYAIEKIHLPRIIKAVDIDSTMPII